MIKALLYYPVFYFGYLFFKLTNKTWWYSYVSFRRLFVMTKGASNDAMSRRISRSFPPNIQKAVNGVLGKLTESNIDNIVKQIEKDGFYIFDTKLGTSIQEQLVQFSIVHPLQLIPPKDGLKTAIYDRNNLMAPRYQFDEQELFKNKLIQQISFDPSLYAVAQSYLNCVPVQDLSAMWWSAAFSREASSEAAQLYHFDMDRFKFIKFFFYLTDVDSSNGPHCYVRGSHKKMPEKLWKDGRIQDKEVFENFSKDDIKEITGVKGTIIAVDTRGLHKGKVLERGERLIFQIEYTNSLFGAEYESIDLRGFVDEEVKNKMQSNRHSFQRFKV